MVTFIVRTQKMPCKKLQGFENKLAEELFMFQRRNKHKV